MIHVEGSAAGHELHHEQEKTLRYFVGDTIRPLC